MLRNVAPSRTGKPDTAVKGTINSVKRVAPRAYQLVPRGRAFCFVTQI